MLTLAYQNVGRTKKTWTTTCILSLRKPDGSPNKDAVIALEDRMLSEVRKSGALMSRDIDVCINEDLATATIFAGVRPVGTVTITPTTP
jgi:hypothetical protein